MFNLMAFLSYVFVVSFTPGPNNIMSMVNASKFGFRNTIQFILGVSAGFFVIMSLCSYFNLLLFNIMPKVKIFMGVLGAGYMMYLAVKIMKTKEEDKSGDQEDNDSSSKIEPQEKGEDLNSFLTGMTLQFVNPKGILYGITVVSNFIIPYYKSTVVLLLFSIFLAFVALMSTASWALFGSLFKKLLSRYRREFNISMGLLLVYSAISISGIAQLFH
ncbi:LysE family transporter [Anaerosolibacter sp.]|uniref:LysE family transporter n=1 Tax=Anaerosolibacter sp. TaxID=1872527 RepID=UPI0039F060E1